MMEKGTATLGWGEGLIKTARKPSPVYFDPAVFSNVQPGPVDFVRSASKPNWAVEVVNTAEVDALVAVASLGDGLPQALHDVTRAAAVRFLAEAQFAPTPAAARAHLKYARGRMEAIALALEQGLGQADPEVIRTLLKS